MNDDRTELKNPDERTGALIARAMETMFVAAMAMLMAAGMLTALMFGLAYLGVFEYIGECLEIDKVDTHDHR